MDSTLIEKRDRLFAMIRGFESCAVAFSGGVDSAVLAKAARDVLGTRAVAVTNASPSLADGEWEAARQLAEQIGIRHERVQTDEMVDPAYSRNAADRCYHCKSHLYRELDALAARLGVAVVLHGNNADDLHDYRPGTTAADEHAVRSPLAECRITKAEVRALARDWGLPVWDKPATPCLASRIAYGEKITPERLAQIDAAERILRAFDLPEVRVRYHRGALARLEVPASAIDRIAEPAIRMRITEQLKALGFVYITLDLEGFRSGSLNRNLGP